MIDSISNAPLQNPDFQNPDLQNLDRRSFLGSLVSVGLSSKALLFKSEKESETVYRILTPQCEVRMSVEYFGNSEVNRLRFRDSLAQRAFCLAPNGAEDPNCDARFSGSIAIAHYHFRSRGKSQSPLSLRECVLTIDHHNRMESRPPFERLLAVQRETVSDIQAFGYNPASSQDRPLPLWCLLRQDLFLNQEPAAFLVVHWKHTFDAITLLDVIPGERTELVQRVD